MFAPIFLTLLSLAAAACTSDSDCTAVDSNQRCCRHQETNTSSCYDIRFQQCCQNVVCMSYANCCNTTCCSSRQACKTVKLVGTEASMCSHIEKRDVIRGYTSFGVPIVLGVFAVAAYALAFMLFFIHRVRFTPTLVIVIASASWCWIWAILLLISQFSLPAFLLCAVTTASVLSLAAVAPAHAPTQVICTTLAGVAAVFLMMINPFASNSLFSFSPYTDRLWGGVLGRAVTGLSQEQLEWQNSNPNALTTPSCTGWYNGYWRRDSSLYHSDLYDPIIAKEPRGLCGRHYQFYIGVIATFETAGLPILFLALVARLWEVRAGLSATA